MTNGWRKLNLFFDALVLVQAINLSSQPLWEIKHLVLEIVNLLKLFEHWSVQWMRREDNKSAHAIGQYGMRSSTFGLLVFGEIPRPDQLSPPASNVCNLEEGYVTSFRSVI